MITAGKGLIGRFTYHHASREWALDPAAVKLHRLPSAKPTIPTPPLLETLRPDDRPRLESTIGLDRPAGSMFQVHYSLVSDSPDRSLLLVGQSVSGEPNLSSQGFILDVTRTLDDQIREAVNANNESRAAIEQVKGALMLCCEYDEEAAFQTLVSLSSVTNVKLRAIATYLADHLADANRDRHDPKAALLELMHRVADDPGMIRE